VAWEESDFAFLKFYTTEIHEGFTQRFTEFFIAKYLKEANCLKLAPIEVEILLFFSFKKIKDCNEKRETMPEKKPIVMLLKLQKTIAINLRTMNLGLFSKNKLSLHKLQNL